MHHMTALETPGKYRSVGLNCFQMSNDLKQQFKSEGLKYDYKELPIACIKQEKETKNWDVLCDREGFV